MLVVPGVSQQQGPHQCGVVRQGLLLNGHRQPEIFHPVRVAESAAVTAHHQGQLGGGALAVDLGDDLHLAAAAGLNGVPVDVQHEADRGVFLEIPVNGGQGPVIGPGVFRVVVQRPVVKHGDASLAEHFRHGVPHADHVVSGVRGAAFPGPDDAVVRGRGVGLAAVTVEDQDLGGLPGELRPEGLQEFLIGEGILGGIADVDLAADGVAAGIRGHQGLGGNAVVRSGGGGSLLGLLLHRLRHRGGGRGFRLLLRLLPEIADLLPGGKQQGRLAQGQHRGGGQAVRLAGVPQLPAQQGQGHLPLQGLPGPGGVRTACGHADGPQCGSRQQRRPQPPGDPGGGLPLFHMRHLLGQPMQPGGEKCPGAVKAPRYWRCFYFA